MGNTQARRRLNAKDFQYIANNTALLNMQIVTEWVVSCWRCYLVDARCWNLNTKRRLFYENFPRRDGDQGSLHYCPGTSLSWHRNTLMERFRPRTSRRSSTWPSLRGSRIRWKVTISNFHLIFTLYLLLRWTNWQKSWGMSRRLTGQFVCDNIITTGDERFILAMFTIAMLLFWFSDGPVDENLAEVLS